MKGQKSKKPIIQDNETWHPQYYPKSQQEESEGELWREAAIKLFEKHNPGLNVLTGIGQNILKGFLKDMTILNKYFIIIRKTK